MLLRLEILLFFISFGYIVYYGYDVFFAWYNKRRERSVQRELKRKERQKQQELAEENGLTADGTSQEKKSQASSEPRITPWESKKISDIIKRAELNMSRGYIDSARSLIIEWLALKKDDRALNQLLAETYEQEKKYENARFIYKDLIEMTGGDATLYKKLANVHMLMENNKKAIVNYEKALEKERNNAETLDILAHLSLEENDYERALKYANAYIKERPRDAVHMGIKGYCQEKLGKTDEAIKIYQEVLNIQPYNSDITTRLKNLESQNSGE